MSRLLILAMFFLISCSSKPIKNSFDFYNTNLSFEEFKSQLEVYANENPYPNIDY